MAYRAASLHPAHRDKPVPPRHTNDSTTTAVAPLPMARSPKNPVTQPRKIPTQPRAEMTVSALLEAAALVLESAGFEGFNTNEVARRAGVSVGSLYQYFPAKEAILLALMRREKQRFYQDALAALEQERGADGMTQLIAAAVRQQLQRPHLARLLDEEEHHPMLRDEARAMGSFSTLIQHIIGKPDLPQHANIVMAARDVSEIIRALTDAAGDAGETDLADLQRRVSAAVFGYLTLGRAQDPN